MTTGTTAEPAEKPRELADPGRGGAIGYGSRRGADGKMRHSRIASSTPGRRSPSALESDVEERRKIDRGGGPVTNLNPDRNPGGTVSEGAIFYREDAAKQQRIARGVTTAADEAASDAKHADFRARGKENLTIARTTNAQAGLVREREREAGRMDRERLRTGAATAALVPKTTTGPGGETIVSQGGNFEVVQPQKRDFVETPVYDDEGNRNRYSPRQL